MEEKRKPLPLIWWTITALMLLVAYPLSLAPIGWGLETIGIDNDDYFILPVLSVFYTPVVLLVENLPGFHDIYKPYNDWWLN